MLRSPDANPPFEELSHPGQSSPEFRVSCAAGGWGAVAAHRTPPVTPPFPKLVDGCARASPLQCFPPPLGLTPKSPPRSPPTLSPSSPGLPLPGLPASPPLRPPFCSVFPSLCAVAPPDLPLPSVKVLILVTAFFSVSFVVVFSSYFPFFSRASWFFGPIVVRSYFVG